MIRRFDHNPSMSNVNHASAPFLSHERPGRRKTFFAV